MKFNPEVNVGHILIVLSMFGGGFLQGMFFYGHIKENDFKTARNTEVIAQHSLQSEKHFEKLDSAIAKLSEVSARLQTEQARQAETIRLIYPNSTKN